MKKLFLIMAAAMLTASASAQRTTITANKAQDNWYIGINGGVATAMNKFKIPTASATGLLTGTEDYGFMKGVVPTVGVRIGKNLTTVFGLAVDASAYFEGSNKSLMKRSTFIDGFTVDAIATMNLNNFFAGYKGEPRPFEVIALAGAGYTRSLGKWSADDVYKGSNCKSSGINVKAGLDFALNLGAAKAVQVYLEPAVVFGGLAANWANPFKREVDPVDGKKKYNGLFQLTAGLNYKFMNSNGTHNYKIEELRDQAEIDGLNAKINELRADVNSKDGKLAANAREIADLKAKLAACEARPVQTIVEEKKENILQPMVIFRQGKSTIDAAQYASIEMVAKYMRNHKDAKVIVRGFASPEGNAELNQKLSEARAASVKNALIKKYKIAASRITTEGLGATDKLSDEIDFNRVAMFIDTTKQ